MVNAYNVWFAVFGFFGLAIITPAIYGWVLPQVQSQPIHVRFLTSLIPPFLVLMLGASWLQSG